MRKQILLLFCFVCSIQAFAGDFANNSNSTSKTILLHKRKIIRNDPSGKIEGLEFSADEAPIEMVINGKNQTVFAVIRGKIHKTQSSLKANSRNIPLSGNNEFNFKIKITPENSKIEFATSEKKETVMIDFNDWETYKSDPEDEIASNKRAFFQGGLGVTSFQFNQAVSSNVYAPISYSSFALTGKVSISYLITPPTWDVSISSFMTFFQITKSTPANVQFLGANFRVGYWVPSVEDPWSLLIAGGYYFTTMSVTGGTFGYKNLTGPQLFPVIRRKLPSQDSISAYIKYSPISSSFSLLSLDNREFAFGGGYSFHQKKNHSISVTLDYANVVLKSGLVSTSSNSITLGAAYSL